MTLLGYNDGSDFHDGVSYLKLVEFITIAGPSPNKDLEELFRRIVFNICVKNTDDHLRNHGFLLTNNGWILSPAFDMNPVETGTGLKLNISETDNSLNLDLAMEVSKYFRLSEQQASEIITVVKNSINSWKDVAAKYKISQAEQERMSMHFGRLNSFQEFLVVKISYSMNFSSPKCGKNNWPIIGSEMNVCFKLHFAYRLFFYCL